MYQKVDDIIENYLNNEESDPSSYLLPKKENKDADLKSYYGKKD